MLSIGAMRAGQGSYYQNLAQDDYYLEGGEPPGQWWGKGAAELGLGGTVSGSALKNLFRGYDQHETPLIQNAGRMTGAGAHQPGWDLTFSAPKSVSVYWSQADSEDRRLLQAEHDKAVKAALGYLEDHHAMTRRGKGGTVRESARLVVALFEHGTSRALDPQLHTHALVMNVGTRADGTTGTIVSKSLYEAKMTAGALYRAEFATSLREMGIAVERDRSSFRVVGVPQELVDQQSKRREAILEKLGADGLESAAAAATATLSTREAKDIVPPRGELFQKWRTEAGAYSFSIQAPAPVNEQAVRAEVVKECLGDLTSQHSHFTELQLIRSLAQASTPFGWSTDKVLQVASGTVRSEHVLTLNPAERIFSTPEVLKDEKRLFRLADKLAKEPGLGVEKNVVDAVLQRYEAPRNAFIEEVRHHAKQIKRAARKQKTEPVDRKRLKIQSRQTLSDEQREAVRYMTKENGGQVRVVEGIAGSGKTTALRAAHEAWEAKGYQVIGAAISGRATRELAQGSGIKSVTLKGLLWILANDTPLAKAKRNLSQAPKGIARLVVPGWFKMLKTDLGPKTRIDKKTVVVLDEAGMLDTKLALTVARYITRTGAQLQLVGDRSQCPPIHAGAPFPEIADKYGRAFLSNITRQEDERDRALVKTMSDMSEGREGRIEKALSDLASRKLLTVAVSQDKAIDALVADWHQREQGRYKDSLIFVSTNAEASKVSVRCQSARMSKGELDKKKSVAINGFTFYAGDRVLITKRSQLLKVENGDIATLEEVKGFAGLKSVRLKLDDGRRVVLPLKEFGKHLRPGYAITTHKGQGTTIKRSYILAGGPMTNQQLSYVQLSRHREAVRVFTSEAEAGPNLSALAKAKSRSGEKVMASVLATNELEVSR